MGLGLVAVFLTSSRSALVLAGLSCVFGVLLLPRASTRVLALTAIVIAAGVLVAGLSDRQKQRIASIVSSDTYAREESTRGRLIGYQVGWEIFTRRPLLGVGPGNWSAYRVKKVDGDALLPHNLPGQILATRGALGTLAFLAFLVSVVALAAREIRRRRAPRTPYDDAVRALAFAVLFTLGLLLVSGLAAHNLERANWVLAPAFLIAAVTCKREPIPEPRNGSAMPPEARP
jgi:O-antigen ligase